jgi:hypothetical protein
MSDYAQFFRHIPEFRMPVDHCGRLAASVAMTRILAILPIKTAAAGPDVCIINTHVIAGVAGKKPAAKGFVTLGTGQAISCQHFSFRRNLAKALRTPFYPIRYYRIRAD